MRYMTTVNITLRTSKGALPLKPGDTFESKEDICDLANQGKVIPVKDVMRKKYDEHLALLSRHGLSLEEIRDADPAIYRNIMSAQEDMDNFYKDGNLKLFLSAMNRILYLFRQQVRISWEKMNTAVKIHSNKLNCAVWLAPNLQVRNKLLEACVAENIYTFPEIAEIGTADIKTLDVIHAAKKEFRKAIVKHCKHINRNVRESENDD